MHGGYEQEVSIIAEVNMCDFEPWVLPGLSAYQSNDPEWVVSVPNGVSTDWVIHEYHPTFNFHTQRGFFLCKLRKDPDENMPTFEEGWTH